MSALSITIIGAVALTISLAVIRAAEILAGHAPTPELTAAFTSSVALTVTLLAAGHVANGTK